MAKREWIHEMSEQSRAYIKAIRLKTVCAKCGATPIDWHKAKSHIQISRLTSASISMINAAIARCTPLCRSCHQKEHSRLRGSLENETISIRLNHATQKALEKLAWAENRTRSAMIELICGELPSRAWALEMKLALITGTPASGYFLNGRRFGSVEVFWHHVRRVFHAALSPYVAGRK
jgi:hypothetical protein